MALLSLTDLKKSYRRPDGSRHAVVDIAAFTLEAGAQRALRGESGSGKTTFLNLIAGILAPDSGRVELDGRDLAQLGEAARDRLRAERIGYIFQTFNLLQGHTVLENVELGMAFGRGVDRAHAEALLRRVGLGERLHHFPASSPPASSSASPSPARWPATRNSSSPTSRPATSTLATAARRWRSSARSAGKTAPPSCSSATTSACWGSSRTCRISQISIGRRSNKSEP